MTIASINNLSQLASTSVATYGSLSRLGRDELKSSLTTGENNPNFTNAQADALTGSGVKSPIFLSSEIKGNGRLDPEDLLKNREY